jgi:hypothetical protein
VTIKIKNNRRTARMLVGVLREVDFSDVFGYARLQCCRVLLGGRRHQLATPCLLIEPHTASTRARYVFNE